MCKPKGRVFLAVLAFSSALLAAPVPDEPADSQVPLFPADAQERWFGASLDVSGRWAVVAAPGSRKSDVPYLRGAAYVFERGDENKWEQQAKILPAPGPAGTFRVAHVAIDARTVVISGTEQTRAGEMGVAHVYMRNGHSQWRPRAILRSESVVGDDGFGSALAIHGDTLIVGASGEGEDSGAAHIFSRAADGQWHAVTRLAASDAHASARFGSSVAVHGKIALVGSYACDDRKGAVYAFMRNESGVWLQEAKLVPDPDAARSLFGAALAVQGNRALVGAPGEDDFEGAAYLFTRSSDGKWSRSAKLKAGDGLAFDQFGISVALARDAALIGANHGDHSAPRINGAAYLFERQSGEWTQKRKVQSLFAGEKNDFGRAVALSDDAGFIGAHELDESAGAAFLVPCTRGCDPPR